MSWCWGLAYCHNSTALGESVDVTVVREGEAISLRVALKATPFINYYGMRLRDLSKKEAKSYDTSAVYFFTDNSGCSFGKDRFESSIATHA